MGIAPDSLLSTVEEHFNISVAGFDIQLFVAAAAALNIAVAVGGFTSDREVGLGLGDDGCDLTVGGFEVDIV